MFHVYISSTIDHCLKPKCIRVFW